MVLTKDNDDVRLYLDGGLQFSSIDEHRYHEVLVHIPMAQAQSHHKVLVLGGGDGLVVRELLKYKDIREITLVDLDPAVVELANSNPHLLALNKGSLMNDKVEVIHQDAFEYLEHNKSVYDVIIVDLPDPNNESLNKLYTKEFYSLNRNHLKEAGAMMVQATSPVFAREVYWTISNTIRATGLHIENFHVDVPSFGNWGFVLASRKEIQANQMMIKPKTAYLTTELVESLTYFGEDEGPDGVTKQVNTLIDPILIPIYEKSWVHY